MKMNYFVVGTNDMRASKAFYDALFAGAGLQTMSPTDRMTYWLGEDFAFAIATPFNESTGDQREWHDGRLFCRGEGIR